MSKYVEAHLALDLSLDKRKAVQQREEEKMRQRAASPTTEWLNRKYGVGHGIGGSHAVVELLRDLDLRIHKVYKITCVSNGKAYIGMTTKDVHVRWRVHCSKQSRCWALKAAIEKYGKDAFKVDVLASCLGASEAAAEDVAGQAT